MKQAWILLMGCLLTVWADADVLIKRLELTGNVSAEELLLQMSFEAEVEKSPARLKVLEGAVLPTHIQLPRGARMVLEGGAYCIDFSRKGNQSVSIDFEAKVLLDGQLRSASFTLPDAMIRQITLETEKEGYKVDVLGAPQTQKLSNRKVQAYVPSAGNIQLQWSPELEKLSGDLVASCESILVGTAKVGALQVQGQYHYSIPQGRLKHLSMKLPRELNIIQVTGADLLAWDVRGHGDDRQLLVELSRSHEKEYVLTIQAEKSLPKFPCSFDFPVIEPRDVIRANGVVLVGTDSIIKLLVNELSGVTQVEQDSVGWSNLKQPKRGLYAYMFANLPFNMRLSADNIVTSLHAQDQLVLALSENEASVDVKIDLEVRDAPSRDVELELPRDWTVTGVSGQNVADYDVRDRDSSRWIKVYFKKAVSSRTLVNVRLEKTLPAGFTDFDMPFFRVSGAKSERGSVVLRGEVGTRLEGIDLKGLREVNTGSLPVRISDARQAFRFKRSDWTGRVKVRQEQSSIHAESFQLVSLGESGVFGSSLITYNIANAPTRSFELKIPAGFRNVEIHGRDIRNWTQDNERWTVHLKQKVLGDYTLLVTYDYPVKYQGEELSVGGVQTLDTENETGYIVLAGSANLSLAEEVNHSVAILPIDVDEIPKEYTLLVNDSIMHAYKYVAAPHEAQVQIKRFSIQPLLTQVADHITLDTTISKNGEAVTLAVYHIKNTDQQYLPVRLPENASLWSVKVNDAKIQVLDQGDGQVLIPVERRRDPNAPQKIEITYAEQLNELGIFTKMAFRSPQVDTQSVFTRWGFKLPNGQKLINAKGNMEPPAELANHQVGWGLLVADFELNIIFFWISVSCVLGSGLYLLGSRAGYGQGFSFSVSIIILCTLAAALAMGVILFVSSGTLMTARGYNPSEWVFNKAVSGSDGGLQVSLSLADTYFTSAKTLILLLAGLLPVIWAWVSKKRKLVIPFLVILAGLYSFSPYLAWLTLTLPHFMLFSACFIAGRNRGASKQNGERVVNQRLFSGETPTFGKEGYVNVKLLSGILMLTITVAGIVSAAKPQDLVSIMKLIDNSTHAEVVDLQVVVPKFENETQVNVNVHMDVKLLGERDDIFHLLGPGFILKDYNLSSKKLSITIDENGSILNVSRDGEYTISIDYLIPARYVGGEWITQLWIPAALRNNAKIQLPIEGWSLQSGNAIRIQQEGDAAEILFEHQSRLCVLRWRPEERKTDQEQSRFFCDVNTLADFRPGMVGLQHEVLFNIAQGEIQNLQFDVPLGMSITEVHGENMGTWRYDPANGLLEVVLSAPVSASYQLKIGAQIAREKLPYETSIKGITVRNTVMQRGVLAIASSASVQMDVVSVEDLSSINISDAARLFSGSNEASIKRAFRYNRMPFLATVKADQVLPELRLAEETSLDVSAEQIRLSCRLNITISKSGVFALRIQIPEGFDVDSLSGKAVSHWDEVNTGTRELVVNFEKQITGTVALNLMLSRSGRDLESEFSVPRIQIDGVLKHTGTLAVTVERGIRISPVVRDGVSEISPRELGVRQEGSLAYRLLRPDWSIQFQSEVMEPKINVEVLQRAILSEGLLKIHCHVQYDIEHAGVKTFRLQSPTPDIALVISGRNVARVRKVDEENGIWEVELHGKVERQYGMEVAYQVSFAHDKTEFFIRPFRVLGAENQKGFITVITGGRLQVTPGIVSEHLRPEDARSIPRRFGAGDLSDAVLCYRCTESDYELQLNIVRHNAADVLPAQVKSVRLDSVITKDDQSLNNMTMELEPGSLRFLEMRLPEGAEIWSVFVNETAVRPLVEQDVYLIPLESESEPSASVEVMYAQTRKKSFFGHAHSFSGPQFMLPLTNVRWTFYAPEGRYSRFDGTMQHKDVTGHWSSYSGSFDKDQYYSYNTNNSQRFGDSAKENIIKGNEFMQSGDQRSAREAFQKAITYSQGQQDLNEDARVQFRNLVRQQGVVGLVNRRNQLKQSLNQVDEDHLIAPTNEQWSEADVRKIEARLGEKESSTLSELAEKMFDQQQAASVEVHPIRAMMVQQGVKIDFERMLQLQPDTEMKVEFRSASAVTSRAIQALFVALAAGVIIFCGRLIVRLRFAA